MKNWMIGALVVALATTLASQTADAKRLGGGKSTGMQRDMPARTAPDAAPAKPAAPTQGAAPQGTAPTNAATAGAAPAAAGATAAAGKRSWLGPVAGLAAGLGLAALASHLGFGEELASMMLIGLAVMAALALFAFLRRRSGAAHGPALAGAGAGGATPPLPWTAPDTPPSPAPAQAAERRGLDTAPAASVAAAAPVTRVFVPAAFDAEGFERIARTIFIRMQAANDAANLDDLRQFTTPEMFASLKIDLLDRGPSPQATEVKRVEARVLDVADEADRQVVSVRYSGEVVEAAGQAPVAFDEVWHLVRPRSEGAGWAIAGIEQMS